MLDTSRVWSVIVEIIKSDKSFWGKVKRGWVEWSLNLLNVDKTAAWARRGSSRRDSLMRWKTRRRKKKRKDDRNQEQSEDTSWREPVMEMGVVFSLAPSCPDGEGSSSSSPRCIWQQLLFTTGRCRSLSPVSRRDVTLAQAVKDYRAFSLCTQSWGCSTLTSPCFPKRWTVRHPAALFTPLRETKNVKALPGTSTNNTFFFLFRHLRDILTTRVLLPHTVWIFKR